MPKIKKGQRTWFDNFSSYWITNHNNAPIAITCGQDPEDAEGTADFLISAYNGTHGCGVNPDAVPDLLRAAEMLFKLANGLLSGTAYRNADETISFSKSAIEKAKTI